MLNQNIFQRQKLMSFTIPQHNNNANIIIKDDTIKILFINIIQFYN